MNIKTRCRLIQGAVAMLICAVIVLILMVTTRWGYQNYRLAYFARMALFGESSVLPPSQYNGVWKRWLWEGLYTIDDYEDGVLVWRRYFSGSESSTSDPASQYVMDNDMWGANGRGRFVVRNYDGTLVRVGYTDSTYRISVGCAKHVWAFEQNATPITEAQYMQAVQQSDGRLPGKDFVEALLERAKRGRDFEEIRAAVGDEIDAASTPLRNR